MIIDSKKAEAEALLFVAKLMIIAARTAPKARGEDHIKTTIVIGRDKDRLAKKMEENGNTRDSTSVLNADAVVLIGVTLGDQTGEWSPFRAKLIDLGIALGSAVRIASELNVDNRIMRTVGVTAREMNLLHADEIQGIPLSVKGKNIFFDRPKELTLAK